MENHRVLKEAHFCCRKLDEPPLKLYDALMSRDTLQEAEISALVKGGDGLARVNGEVWFVSGGVPGDLVLCQKTEERERYTRARIVKVLQASPDRVEPPCPLAGRCGGCPWQQLAREAQLRAKRNIVHELFDRALAQDSDSRTALEAVSCIPMPGDGLSWRNRFQFHRSASQDIAHSPVGLMDSEGKLVVPLNDCPIAHPLIREALKNKSLKAPLASNRFTVFASGDTLLVEGGKEEARVALLDRDILMKVSLFFQSNVAMLEILLEHLNTYLATRGPFKRTLDLYAGVGTFSLFLKDHSEAITLMEREARSLGIARTNLKGFDAEFLAMSDDNWARSRERQKDSSKPMADFALVDPPRAGLSSRMRSWLASSRIPRIACVSCDPASLARDIAALDLAGYRLVMLEAFEFYPHSPHIESLAILEKR